MITAIAWKRARPLLRFAIDHSRQPTDEHSDLHVTGAIRLWRRRAARGKSQARIDRSGTRRRCGVAAFQMVPAAGNHPQQPGVANARCDGSEWEARRYGDRNEISRLSR